MSQPIDVAYVEVRPDLDKFATTLNQRLTASLNRLQTSVDQSMRQVSDRVGAAGQRAGQSFADRLSRDANSRLRDTQGRFAAAGSSGGRAFGDAFTRDANGRLRDGRGRFVASGAAAGAAITGGLGSALARLGASLTANVGSAITNITTNLWNLIPALAAAAAGMALVVPSAYLLGGALGALPGIVAGLGAALATLGLGFFGLGDHFKSAAKGAGGAGAAVVDNSRAIAAAERQVSTAERRLAEAQRERLAVQNAVNEATLEARERIEDLSRSLRRARIDEERATEEAAAAQEAYNFALESGDPESIREARRALEEANITVEEAKDRTEDLTREKAESDRKGIQGSDEVTGALERQRDATQAVKDAQLDLVDAQLALRDAQKPAGGGGGGGGVAQELTKIAPAAKRVVDVIKSLKPAFDDLRLDVQQRLFTGLDKTIKRLATAWFPQLKVSLGGFADTFNAIAKNLGRSLIDPRFIKNTAAGMESFRKLLERVGLAVSGPLVDAFGRLSRAAGPFIEQLGDEIASIVEDFSAWIASADKTGALDNFFQRASQVLHDIFAIGRDVASIVGSIIKIFIGEEATTNTPFRGIRDGLDQLARWFDDPKNQEMIRGWIRKVEEFVTWFITEGIPKVQSWINTAQGWINRVEGWINRVQGWKNNLTTVFGVIATVVRSSMGVASTAIANVGNAVGVARAAFGRLRDGATSAVGRVASVAASLPGRITRAVGNLNRTLYGAGRDVVYGLWDGISSLGGWLFNKITSFVKANIPGPVRKALGIDSPSKVTAELGRDTARGVVVGLDDEASAVEGAARRLALAAVPAGGAADTTIARLQALTAPAAPGFAATGGVAATGGDLAAIAGLLAGLRGGDAEPITVNVQLLVDGRALDARMVQVVATANREQARKLAARPRTV